MAGGMEKYKEDAKKIMHHIKVDAEVLGEKAIDKTKEGLTHLEKKMKK